MSRETKRAAPEIEREPNDSSAPLTEKERILVRMLEDEVERLGAYSWRWKSREKGAPSLSNRRTSALFRARLVEESEGKMVLTTVGRILAERAADFIAEKAADSKRENA